MEVLGICRKSFQSVKRQHMAWGWLEEKTAPRDLGLLFF